MAIDEVFEEDSLCVRTPERSSFLGQRFFQLDRISREKLRIFLLNFKDIGEVLKRLEQKDANDTTGGN